MSDPHREIWELRHELDRVTGEKNLLEHRLLALKSGGGEITLALSPYSAPFNGKPVNLYSVGSGWLPDTYRFSDGFFKDESGCVSYHADRAILWKPA